MVRVLVCYIILSVIAISNIFAQTINWEIQSNKKVHWLKNINDSLLIVGSKNNISAFNNSSGEKIWEQDGFKSVDKSLFVNLKSSNRALFFQYKRNMPRKGNPIMNLISPHILDMQTGESIASNIKMGIYHSLGVYELPNNDLLFFAYDRKKNISMRVIKALTGEILWVDSLTYKKDKPYINKHQQKDDFTLKTIIGNQPPIFDTDSTMILLNNKKYVRKWNIKTGEIIWSKELKQKNHTIVKQNFATAQLNNDSTIIYMVHNNSLCAIHANHGSVLWKSIDLRRRIKQIEQNDSLIILKTISLGRERKYIQIFKINKADGTVLYTSEDICQHKEDLPLLWNNNNLILYADKHLYKFDIDKNHIETLTEKLNLKHGDKPTNINIINGSYYLESSQNLLKIDSLGNLIFHTEIKPPDITLAQTMKLVGLFALNVYVNSANPYYFPRFLDVPEFKSSDKGYFFNYMLKDNVFYKQSGCDGIVRIDYFTGELDSEICLRTNTPIYAINEIDDCIYFVKDKKTIICQSWKNN